MRVYRTTDVLDLKIGELVFKFSPLSYEQKLEIQGLLAGGKEFEGALLALRYSIKGVEGLEDKDGKPYKITHTDGKVDTECIDDLTNIDGSMKLQLFCANLVNGVSTKLIHPVTKEEIEGVEVVLKEEKDKKKKR